MTADEVEEYITQIAFSGATAFLEKYKDKTNKDQIIGHFGLGFYSAFMVADDVEIDTLSFQEGAAPVHWECDGGTEYDYGLRAPRHAVGTGDHPSSERRLSGVLPTNTVSERFWRNTVPSCR